MDIWGVPFQWFSPILWLFFGSVRENPNLKWMRTGGYPMNFRKPNHGKLTIEFSKLVICVRWEVAVVIFGMGWDVAGFFLVMKHDGTFKGNDHGI